MPSHRVAIVFPAEPGRTPNLQDSRFAETAAALSAVGLAVEGAPYSDDRVAEVRAQLLRADGALVWINPIVDGRDRSVLNAMLTGVASEGVYVSAHPEVIDTIGTKEILYRTRGMGWGCDIRKYLTFDAMRAELPVTLASGMPRVLKRMRGQSGDGVWKVETTGPERVPRGPDVALGATVRVTHAKRGSAAETMPLEGFMARCAPYFADGGGAIDQIYQPRLAEGMVRCYLVQDRVAGFGEQLVNALYPAESGDPTYAAPQPGPRLYYPSTRPDFQRLKRMLEQEWLDELCRSVELKRDQLPIIWDADFLYGAKDAEGADTYVLCEINASSVYPFPDGALAPLALATRAQLQRRR